MADPLYGPGDLTAATLTTWIFQLFAAGARPAEAAIAAGCEAVDAAQDAETGDAAGLELMRAVQALLGEGEPTLEAVRELIAALYGDAVTGALGAGTREERVAAIRSHQFNHGTPWLARIWERQESGAVAPSWLLVERASEAIYAMDPNPWNDVDEDRVLPWGDFQVLWELDACTSFALQA
ncbi:MAG: hypothetical protein JXX28_14565 [Deltaproteobacteria bacterium]|nr:hypothetical protein [Deltaproteobacteria bacterium]